MVGKEEKKLASSYDRKFVFLLPEDKGYEVAMGKVPKGHIEIERKKDRLQCKVFVENLKEMSYQIQIFTQGGKQAVLGELMVEKNGKAEGKYSTSDSNVVGSGFGWQDFEVIVIRPSGAEYSKKAPLVSWLTGKKGQIPFFNKEGQKKLQKSTIGERKPAAPAVPVAREVPEAPPAIEEKEIKQAQEQEVEEVEELEEIEEVEVEQESIQEPIKEEQIEENQEKNIESLYEEESKAQKEHRSQEEYWVDFGADFEEEREYQEEAGQEEQGVNLESPYYYVNENIDQLQKNVMGIAPFLPPLKNHKWWKIPGEEKDLEGFYLFYNGSFVPLTYPYMGYRNRGEEYEREYNGMIFGMVEEEEGEAKQLRYYVYGIPGRLCIQEQPFQGSTGFLYWHPAKDNKRERGAMGYWLLYIDAQTGTIAVPKRPTMPPVCKD